MKQRQTGSPPSDVLRKKGRLDCVVVGAGPAGMMAAIRTAQLGIKVSLIELNTAPGRKLLLTGAGRCNLTNTGSLDAFLEHFSSTGNFLRDAFKVFDNRDLMEFFETRGLKLKVEEGGRVFPSDDKASSVVAVLECELRKLEVARKYGRPVQEVLLQDSGVSGVKLGDGSTVQGDSVILATGGLSYSFTGSKGQGIRMAGESGHLIVPPSPGLMPIELEGPVPGQLEGVSIDKTVVTFIGGKKKIKTRPGGLIFTANGISGPAVISCSGAVRDLLHHSADVRATIDIAPDGDAASLEKLFMEKFAAHPGKTLKRVIEDMFPKRLVEVLLELAALPRDKTANQCSKQQRKVLVESVKGMVFKVAGTAPIEKAMITRGGVSVKDIAPRTMASRKVKGLYFAGEMIDVDADTGGFNLQACFSTGYLAGQSAASN